MGRNIPSSRRQRLHWMESMIEQWTTNQAAIGLSVETITSLTAEIDDARDASTRSTELHAAAISATTNYHAQADTAHALASDAVKTIKAFAENSAAPGKVYALAAITPKAAASPVAAPAMPVVTGISINGIGSVTIAWDGSGPTGTSYLVRRKNAGERAFVIIGLSGPSNKRLTDKGVPAGTPSATYTVQAVRGDEQSKESPPTTIQFGNLAPVNPVQVSGASQAA